MVDEQQHHAALARLHLVRHRVRARARVRVRVRVRARAKARARAKVRVRARVRVVASFSFCVVTPTGQLFVWQMRAAMQPTWWGVGIGVRG